MNLDEITSYMNSLGNEEWSVRLVESISTFIASLKNGNKRDIDRGFDMMMTEIAVTLGVCYTTFSENSQKRVKYRDTANTLFKIANESIRLLYQLAEKKYSGINNRDFNVLKLRLDGEMACNTENIYIEDGYFEGISSLSMENRKYIDLVDEARKFRSIQLQVDQSEYSNIVHLNNYIKNYNSFVFKLIITICTNYKELYNVRSEKISIVGCLPGFLNQQNQIYFKINQILAQKETKISVSQISFPPSKKII